MFQKHSLLAPSSTFFELLCVLVLCMGAVNCGESCISGVFNPPNSMFQVKTCSVSASNGSMSVGAQGSDGSGAAVTVSASSRTFRMRHLFVAVSGIEIRAEGSSQWQEIASALESNPIQIDLLGDASAEGPWPIDAEVSPGNYSALRLRLPSESENAKLASRENPCGEVGLHCAVMSDGTIRPLRLEGTGHVQGNQSLPAQIPEGFLRVMPDTRTDVGIVFQGAASNAVEFGGAVLLAAVLTAETRGFGAVAGRP